MNKLTHISVSILIFSIFVGSFFWFQYQNVYKSSVQKAQAQGIYEAPINSSIVSNTTNENEKTISYTTTLTKDQIIEFYDKLALLNSWSKVNNSNYNTKNGKVTITVEKEAEGKSLVKYKEENNK